MGWEKSMDKTALAHCRYPVSIPPEEAMELIDIFHEIKTRSAGLALESIFAESKRGLQIMNHFVAVVPCTDPAIHKK